MKFLIACGNLSFEIPELDIRIEQTDSGSFNAFAVVDALIELGHDITVLTNTKIANEKCKVIEFTDLDSLLHQLRYLGENVKYDAIGQFVKLPEWHQVHVDLRENYPALYLKHAAELNPITDLMHCLSMDTTAHLIVRDNLSWKDSDSYAIVNSRIDLMKDDDVYVTIFDIPRSQRNKANYGYILGKNGGTKFTCAERMEYTIIQAFVLEV
jgi:hypothetical protein